MGDVLRIVMLCVILAASTLPAAAFDGPTQTTGAKKSTKPTADKPAADKAAADDDKSSAADEKGKTVAMAQQALEAGIKAYGAGKNDDALRAFDAALRGGLPSQQMARLLYYRGLTYRKGGKPGLAISDLTSAVWLKNGLSEAEKQDAIKARAVAYHEAGISDVPAVPQSAFPDAPAMPSTPSAPGWQTAMTEGAAPPTAAPVSNAPAAPTPPSSGGGIGGFFSSITNMFSSSSSSAPKADESAVNTSSIDNNTPPPASAVESASWTGTTQVAAAPPPAPAAQAPAPQAVSSFETKVAAAEPPAPPAARAPSGKFRLQVAAVRSRDEADVLAGRILQQHSAELGGRQPVVDEAVIGSMGTFYRVRLGPYANAKEPGQLCGALRADGFDCLVVTQ